MQNTLVPQAELERIQHILESDNHANRAAIKKALRDPLFTPRFHTSLRMEREMALERLLTIAQNKFISVYDFEKNPLNILAAHEVIGMVDGSVATKMTVNWNLYGIYSCAVLDTRWNGH
jgi:acyl-CoA oxidase